jgi:hypothetical protein
MAGFCAYPNEASDPFPQLDEIMASVVDVCTFALGLSSIHVLLTDKKIGAFS